MKVSIGFPSHTYKTVVAAFLAVLLLTGFSFMPPALAQTEDSTCQGPCCESSDMQCCAEGAMGCCQTTQYTSSSGQELNKTVASALSNQNVTKLLVTFATQGYTPQVNKASALVISNITLIGIPFDTHEDASLAGIAFSPETNIPVGAVIDPINETHAWITMYYIDGQGEIVSTTFVDDWGSCVAECILHIVDIMHLSGLLELCWGSCVLCIVPPHISCVICLACMGAPVAGCATACTIACWLWGC